MCINISTLYHAICLLSFVFSTPTPNTKISGISYIGVFSVALWPDTQDFSDNKILAQPRKAMNFKFHCQGNRKNLAITVFPPRHYILYFQIIFSGRTGGLLLFCTVFRAQWLIELIFYSFRFDKASTYSCWIVYISMSFIGDSYVRNLVHEMVITLISIYTKEFVCIVNNQNIHWDGYTAQWFNGFIRVFHCWSNWGNTSRFIISW